MVDLLRQDFSFRRIHLTGLGKNVSIEKYSLSHCAQLVLLAISDFFLLLLFFPSQACGKPVEEVTKDASRTFYMSPQEAVQYGLIDKVRACDSLLALSSFINTPWHIDCCGESTSATVL